ncbi:MAG: hypothetical protein JXP37_09300 [Coriobacteriia bacterium]|nr:hypothetical protein [Coriobacteriia bacterium]
MKSPAGVECAFYYEDFARGAARQECRAPRAPRSAPWKPADCRKCPVPGILAANGSPYLEIRIRIRSGVLGMGSGVDAEAWCALHGPIDGDPRVGCALCNQDADELLRRALD